MVQSPPPVSETSVPVTVHGPVAANVTSRPEVAVADTAKSASPNVASGRGSKEIDCASVVWVKFHLSMSVGFPLNRSAIRTPLLDAIE